MIKKLTACLLCLLLLFGILAPSVSVSANPDVFQGKQDAANTINLKFKNFNRIGFKDNKGQAGVLYNMKMILLQALWVNAVDQSDFQKVVPVQPEIISYQKEVLINYIKSFNETYKEDGTDYKGVEITPTQIAENDFDFDKVIKDMTAYVTQTLDSLLTNNNTGGTGDNNTDLPEGLTDTTNSSDTDKKKDNLDEKNKRVAKYLYEICISVTREVESINNIIPVDRIDEGDEFTIKPLYVYAPYVAQIASLLNDDKYKSLLEKGREVSSTDISKLSLDNFNMVADLFRRMYKDGAPKKGELLNTYWMMFSCTSVLEPFTSTNKSPEYTTALRRLTNTNKDILDTFEEAIKFAKPLYMVDLTMKGEIKDRGAYPATFDMLVKAVKEEQQRALVLPKGTMQMRPDSDSWVYSRQDRNNWENLSDGNKIDSTTNPDGTTNEAEKDDTIKTDKNKKPTDSIDDTDYFLGDTIKNLANVTDPVLKLGGTTDGYVNYLDFIVLRNILQESTFAKDLTGSHQYLFMDFLGNIILEDGTIVLPAASNPRFYKEGENYYPYTMAFMKSYPSITTTGNTFFTNNNRDKSKYYLSVNMENEELTNSGEADGSLLNFQNQVTLNARELVDDKSISILPKTKVSHKINLELYQFGDVPSFFKIKEFEYNRSTWDLRGQFNNFKVNFLGSAGGNEYPLVKTNTTDHLSANSPTALFSTPAIDMKEVELGAIAKNTYLAIMRNKNGDIQDAPNSSLNSKLIAQHVYPQILNGVKNPEVFSKNMINSFDEIIKGGFFRLNGIVRDFAKDFLKPIQTVKGVIGVLNAHQSKGMGQVVSLLKDWFAWIMVVAVIVIIVKYNRIQADFYYMIISGIKVLSIMLVFVYLAPIYLPSVANLFIYETPSAIWRVLAEDSGVDLAYKTLAINAENYDAIFDKATGEYVANTSLCSINLYKLNNIDKQYVLEKYDIKSRDYNKGKIIPVEPREAGLYFEGDFLKISLDRLFTNNPVTGSVKSTNIGTKSYQFTSYKTTPSSVDYYMPYHLLVDSFVDKINVYLSLYPVERKTLPYGDRQKDSFAVQAYMKSDLFLAPGDWERLEQVVDPYYVDAMRELLGDNYDFLGISKMLAQLPEQGKQSLWYKSMEQAGFLEDKERLAMTIVKINNITKNFMIDNADLFARMSDENIIRIVSLYATMLFNQQFTDGGNTLYPTALNYEEFTLNDIMISVFTNPRDAFMATNKNIVDYISYKHNTAILLVFILAIFLSWGIVYAVQIAMPILYFLLAIFLSVRFCSDMSSSSTVWGYTKAIFIVLLTQALHGIALFLISKANGSIGAVVSIFIVNLILLEVIVRLAYLVFSNFRSMDFGNYDMGMVTPWIIQKSLQVTHVTGNKSVFNGIFKNRERYSGAKSRGQANPYRNSRYDESYEILGMSQANDSLRRNSSKHAKTYMDIDRANNPYLRNEEEYKN